MNGEAKATRHNSLLFQLVALTPDIDDTESGLLPTLRVSATEGGIVKNVELKNGSFSRKNAKGVRWGVKLKDAINYMEDQKLNPTTTVMDSAGVYNRCCRSESKL